MIPFHIAYATADAQGRPIDPATIGDVYWEGWSLYYTGPDDAGLVRKVVAGGQTTQLAPASVKVGGFDAEGSLLAFYATPAPLTAADANGLSDAYAQWNSTYTQLTNGDGPSTNVQYLSPGSNGFRGGAAFESAATNLVAGDANGASDLFVRTFDGNGAYAPAVRVSTTAAGGEANGASYGLIAADWRPMILFISDATNLLGDGQGGLFWKDLGSGVLKRADAAADGTRLAGVTDADISAYGRYVVFASTASNAALGDTNGVADVFLKDMETGALTRVSTATDGSQLAFATGHPTVDSDGRYVAFEGQGQVWVKDVTTGELLKLTDTPGANHILGFHGQQLAFRSDGGGVLEGVTTGGVFVASLGGGSVLRSGVTATSATFTIPDGIDQAFIRSDIGGYTITGNALGNLFVGTPVGNTFIGGGGDDVFRTGSAGNTLTGGAGYDLYIAAQPSPYAPSAITDFRIGEDEVDLNPVLAGRGGADPTVDGYVRFESDGAGGTRILYDSDGWASGAQGTPLFVLKGVPTSSVTWSNITDRDGPSDETPVLSSSPGGQGSAFFHANVFESALRYEGSSVGTGSLYAYARDGIDDLTLAGRAVITDGVFHATSWTTALGNRIEFVGYDPTNGKVTFNYSLLTKLNHPYAGGINDNRVYDDMAVVLTDRDGDAATGTLRPTISDDYPSLSSDLDIVDRNVGRSSGNVITGVRDAETQYSSGVDVVPIDGGAIGRIDIANTTVRDDTPDANGDFVIEGSYGVLTMNLSGAYTYVLKSSAPSTGGETFRYWMKDGDGRPLHENTILEIRFSPGAPGADGGQVITSPGPGSTVTGGPGDDTINASTGADTLTGGDGSDVFAWAQAPTVTARVTDFRVDYGSGGDHIDITKVLQGLGYSGGDAAKDGYVKLAAVGGGTGIFLDRDGPGAGQADSQPIIVLDHVPATTTWSYIGGPGYVYYWASPATLARPEGDSGASDFAFTITRQNGAGAGEGTVTWGTYGTGSNPASGDDFAVGDYPSGEVRFAAGETTKTVTIQVAGDTVLEPEETFQVRLLTSTGGGLQDYRPTGYIGNDDGSAPPPPPADGGRVLTSPGPGSTVTGGAGADTLNASQGSDVLTGGGGADVFRWGKEPWSPATVTDFAVGSDRLDLSALFQASGYTGADPVADRYIRLLTDSSGTKVLFDRDGVGTAQEWPNYIINLQGVTAPVTWAQLTAGGGGSGPAPSTVNISPASVSHAEGQSGLTAFSFTLTRTGDTSRVETTHYQVVPSGTRPADGADFQNSSLPNVSFGWNAGETSRTIVINVVGDAIAEPDETFTVRLVADPGGTRVGADASATGTIVNDDGSGGGTPGQVLTSAGPGSTLTGGAGDDTLNASQGADVLTGNGGADVFAWAKIPWSAARVTDFAAGTDRADLAAILRDLGYTGSDPVADGYVRLVNSFDGRSTHLYVDRDGTGSGDAWGGFTVTLEGLYGGGPGGGPSTVTWAQIAGGGTTEPPPPPPSGDGEVLTSDQYGDTLTGGAGNDTLNAGQGPDMLTGAGGADRFVFGQLVWNSGGVTDFTPGADRIDLSALFDAWPQGVVETRLQGEDTEIYFDRDGAGGEWPVRITTLDGVTPGQLGQGWLIA